MKERTGADYEFLSDPKRQLIDLFDVRHVGRRSGGDIAQSASFLLDGDATVVWLHLATNYRVRPKPTRALAAADRLGLVRKGRSCA